MLVISLEALGDGWTLRCPPVWNDMVFLDRRLALTTATALAARLRVAGCSVTTDISCVIAAHEHSGLFLRATKSVKKQ
jgi:hypothetical protein